MIKIDTKTYPCFSHLPISPSPDLPILKLGEFSQRRPGVRTLARGDLFRRALDDELATADADNAELNDRIKELEAQLKREKEAASATQNIFRNHGPKSFREDWRKAKSQSMEKNRRIRLIVIFIFLLLSFLIGIIWISNESI